MRVRPLEPNTRIRNNHNTAGAIIRMAQPTDILVGDNVFIAPNDLANANGLFQRTGDKWLEVRDSEWIAIIHMGQPICEELPDSGEPTLVHTIRTYDDGTISVDDGPRY